MGELGQVLCKNLCTQALSLSHSIFKDADAWRQVVLPGSPVVGGEPGLEHSWRVLTHSVALPHIIVWGPSMVGGFGTFTKSFMTSSYVVRPAEQLNSGPSKNERGYPHLLLVGMSAGEVFLETNLATGIRCFKHLMSILFGPLLTSKKIAWGNHSKCIQRFIAAIGYIWNIQQ